MTVLDVQDIAKSFTLHLRGGLTLPVVAGVSFRVAAGECVALGGPSGAGKSSILKMIYGNYRTDTGRILIDDGAAMIDVASASPREILALRAATLGYVSQFLRVIPRVAALDIVAEPLRARGIDAAEACDRAAMMLQRLNLPERLWHLPPATFSGGEQQRVNIARGFIADTRLLLLDEPTASLDGANRDAVIGLIRDKTAMGTALVGIFHDDEVRASVADRTLDVRAFAVA
ncbi:phosphonate C-P lyase system protein PhnL [Blastochloris tepida]|uniref:Phosphonate C-P lyase system protein PhnL n=1 Tax=Blastochloris tepida TaxID=2233851 RepID=A0A348G0G3_9HYPH|nr:phosphonate C-P lyase system protein PhnL [Blastochloris tepida]BBF93046.1 phosphonate C-P lyase system protein PhnL [Blastochloris tepida]